MNYPTFRQIRWGNFPFKATFSLPLYYFWHNQAFYIGRRWRTLVNITTGNVLADNIKIADSFMSRLLGLMFRKDMPKDNAIHIQPCQSIHTFFMKFPIDVLYLDGDFRIVGLEENLSKGKIGKLFRGTQSVIELPEGKISETDTKIGDVIQYK